MPSTTLEQGIQAYLTGITGMPSRVYFISAPDGATMPYITYRIIEGVNLNNIVGSNKEQEALVQISLWGEDRYELITLANLVINNLEGYTGTFDGRNILYCTTRGPRQLRDPDFSNLYQFIVDVDITFVR